ncbi:hypothetical protein GH714_000976 [Hevea brasiliensis]|uniref:Uncharacterized protein n=1 Tax=Hevea brasiliensis TaxID=3981 RepID=A0A6A6M9K6_HEVBR|nr:hypothetical protein GH714_000976 [Hevea brasiliensis]
MLKKKNFRKRTIEEADDQNNDNNNNNNKAASDDEEERRLALEEVKFLQKQRERKSGIPAIPSVQIGNLVSKKVTEKNDGDGERRKSSFFKILLLKKQQSWLKIPTLLTHTLWLSNRLKYVEQELAKKRGKNIDETNQVENDLKRAEDELYKIPEHLKVKRRNSEESSTQWTTGIAEVQLPIEYKLRNIEETEAAKKLLQEKRLMGQAKSEFSIPSSYSADYFQRGRDYAEKLRREHPELYKDRSSQDDGAGANQLKITLMQPVVEKLQQMSSC